MMERRAGRGVGAKAVLVGVLVVVVLIVILQNRDEVRLDILMFNVTWPLWILLAAVAAISSAAGWFAGRTRR